MQRSIEAVFSINKSTLSSDFLKDLDIDQKYISVVFH